MRRCIMLMCLVALASGCRSGGPTDGKSGNSDSGGRKELPKDAGTVDVAKDYLVGAAYGPDIQVVSKEEMSVTLFKKPATALHLQWRGKGEEQGNDVFLIQEQRVKEHMPYDMAKSFDENAAAAVRKQEAP